MTSRSGRRSYKEKNHKCDQVKLQTTVLKKSMCGKEGGKILQKRQITNCKKVFTDRKKMTNH